MQSDSLFKKPSACAPLVMSLAALLLILGVLATVGVRHPQDEGAPARIFQLLILLQAPFSVWFAVRWLPRRPGTGAAVLTLQVVAATVAVASIWLVERYAG